MASEPPLLPELDEYWVAEWVAFGLIAFEILLEKWAAFEDYYRRREEQ